MRNLGVLATFVSVLWVLAEGWLAHRNGMLTPTQMFAKYPGQRGLPFMNHGGMWGDILIISPLVGLIVGTYGDTWTPVQIVTMLIIAMILSGVMHWTYVQTPFPDSLAWKGEGITAAGWLHVIYMGAAFAIIGLLYFCTPSPNRTLVLLTGVLLSAHVVVGTHIPLGIFNEYEPMEWCPDFLVPSTGYVVLGAWGVLVAMTMFAVGVSAGLLLAMTVASFVFLIWMWFKLTPLTMFTTCVATTSALLMLLVWMWQFILG